MPSSSTSLVTSVATRTSSASRTPGARSACCSSSAAVGRNTSELRSTEFCDLKRSISCVFSSMAWRKASRGGRHLRVGDMRLLGHHGMQLLAQLVELGQWIHKRIVIAVDAHPGLQHVQLPARIQLLELAQQRHVAEIDGRVMLPRPAIEEREDGSQQQRRRGHAEPAQLPAHPHQRPPCPPGPVSVLRNSTMAALSSFEATRPSWYLNITSTASSSVFAEPSWK